MRENPNKRNRGKTSILLQRQVHIFALTLIMLFSLATGAAFAVMAPANTQIKNKAVASFTDASGVAYSPVTSNEVITTVQRVAAIAISPATNTQYSAPGGIVYFPATITNNGNDTDTITLSNTLSGGFSPTFIGYFVGTSGTPGAPLSPATTVTLPRNGLPNNATTIFAGFQVPAGAAIGLTATNALKGTSGNDVNVYASVNEIIDISNFATVSVTKSVSAKNVDPLGEVTYTLTYTNTSQTTASGNLVITDPLPAPYVDYKVGSAKWNGVSVTDTVDNLVADTSGIKLVLTPAVSGVYFNVTNMVLTLGSVPARATGTFTFVVKARPGAVPGTRVNNIASYQYKDKAGGTMIPPITPATTADYFDVTRTYGVTLVAQAPSTIGPANAGTQVVFTDRVTNNGNMADVFSMDVYSETFPAGTTFLFYNNNSSFIPANQISATPSIAAAGFYDVTVVATLPAKATNTGAPFTLTTRASSQGNNTISATALHTLTAITPASVDLKSDTAPPAGTCSDPVCGQGAFVNANKITATANPGTQAAFSLLINNTSVVNDTFTLTAAPTSTFPGSLPTGWAADVYAYPGIGVCSTTNHGASLASGTLINAGATTEVCVLVTVPAMTGAIPTPPGDKDVYFQAAGTATLATDKLHGVVTVNVSRNLSITAGSTVQLTPNNVWTFTHTLLNSGNVTEGTGDYNTDYFTVCNSLPSWATRVQVFYKDGAGVLTPIPNNSNCNTQTTLAAIKLTGLAPNESISIVVQAQASTSVGEVNLTTVKLTYGATFTSANDQVTVVAQTPPTIHKYQALDANCDGCLGNVETCNYMDTALPAVTPGACIRYRVDIISLNGGPVFNLVVSDDITNAYTAYHTRSGENCFGGSPSITTGELKAYVVHSGPNDGDLGPISIIEPTNCASSGIISVTLGGVLQPYPATETANIYYGVQVMQ